MNTFIQGLNLKENTKGGIYHASTFDENLNLFSFQGRFAQEKEIKRLVSRAYAEDKEMLLKNILYLLDIRGGKGERNMFKAAFKELITLDKELASIVLNAVAELGRWDYVFITLGTDLEREMIEIISAQLNKDVADTYPSLLAKWMPSENTSSQDTRELAKKIRIKLGATSRDYRKILSELRAKIKIVETSLSQKDYSFDYSKVPSKAMMKYVSAFNRNDSKRFDEYKISLAKGETKINVNGITPGKIIAEVGNKDTAVLDAMWKNLKGIDVPEGKNVLVMADTSGSMNGYGESAPINNSIGLAIYFAEKNKGAFKDYFLSFSSYPKLEKVIGRNIEEKRRNIKAIVENTDINKAFKLVLDTTLKANKEDCPSHIIIVSDMEFDSGLVGGRNTNFEHWKSEYAKHGLELPKIIFWNVALQTKGFPVTKLTQNVAMVSGYAPNVTENLFTLETITPYGIMADTLSKYDRFIKGDK